MRTDTSAPAIAETVPRPSGRRLCDMFGHCWHVYAKWRETRRAISRLAALGDRQLKDIGISRCQIESAARRGKER